MDDRDRWHVYRRHADGKTEWLRLDLVGVPEWVATKATATRFLSEGLASNAINRIGTVGLAIEKAS